ncbi:Bax inhibitor-1/YccA family protein [Taklimakanibacter deserti]|uniref:Bax inhibitor-1/YccA family protein n=1 Tax=Taklimakanibacter deserti TaxID=2267839 RepID=UPI000E653724
MAEVRYQPQAQTRAGTQAEIDQGLRSYMLGVYNYMASGLAVTGAVAAGTYMLAVQNGQLTPFGQTLFQSPLMWVFVLAPVALVFFLSFRIQAMRAATAQAVFWIYAALNGVAFSTLGLVYSGNSITRVFFISAATFGALSLWGYTTKRDLTGWGSFLFMGLIGIIIASLVNLFWPNGALQFVISVVGVLVFAGLTAYDTQKIKEMYFEADDGETMSKKILMGALNLYLDFINLFLMMLRLFGSRE